VTQPWPRTIAVVEDDRRSLDELHQLLGSAGYRVVSTNDARAAVQLVRDEHPALLLCNVNMPGMDGYAVLKAIQSDPATAACPVVFLSPNQEFSERIRAFRHGVIDYLTRPLTPEVLLRKVEKALEGRPAGAGAGAPTVTEVGPHAEIVNPPRLPPSAAEMPRLEDIPAVLRSVLVVEDNVIFRTFLRTLLTAQGFTVHEATDGDEGLRMALEHRPWLILTDVRMPGEDDGFEFCRKVRSHSLIRQTPLLFLSGWDDYKARYQGLELGADDFVSKQTPARELLIRIQVILKRYVDMGTRGRSGPGMQGELNVMGAPGVLQVCHLTRLTGTLTVKDGGRRMAVRFREGEIIGAEGDGREGEAAIFGLLAWEEGTFKFAPGDPGAGAPLGTGFSQLVLEGCRRLDERRRADAG
jgi:two-component system, cell cycle response regulator